MTGNVPLSALQVQQIRATYRRVMLTKLVQPKMRGSVYAEKHFKIPPETRGGSSANWINRPFQVAPLDMQVSDQIRELWWQKSARTGATKMIVIGMLQHASNLQRNVGMYTPNDGNRDTFVKVELEPGMRDCREIHRFRRSTKNTAENTLELKMMYGSVWQMLGGVSEGNFRGRSPDTVWCDEMSAFPANIGGGGALQELLDGRVTESVMPKVIGYSSPLLGPHDQITQARESADIQLQYHMPCPHCGEELVLQEFGVNGNVGLVFDHKTGDNAKSASTARYVCHSSTCQRDFDFPTALRQLRHGRWRDPNDSSLFFNHEDGLIHDARGVMSGRLTVGMKSNVLITPKYGFKRYTKRWLDALDAKAAGDVTKLQAFTQTRKGEAWEESLEVETLDMGVLLKRAEPFPGSQLIPEDIEVITTYIDVHKRRFELLTVGWGLGEQCWCLEYGIFQGDIEHQQVWDRLRDYIKQTEFVRTDGLVLNIYKAGIDSGGHWTDTVYAFSRDMGADRVIPCKGELGVGKSIVKYPRKHNDQLVHLTIIATDPVKQLAQARLGIKPPVDDDGEIITGYNQPGMIHFPLPNQPRYQLFTEQFYKELTSEVRKFERGKWSWVQQGKNEAFDCLCGNLAMIRICQLPQFGVVLGEDRAAIFSDSSVDYSEEAYRQAVQDSW